MAVRFRGRQAGHSSSPGGESGGVALAPAFVGREGALADVTGALEQGLALVLVEGEAGIGKTRLLREALAAPSLAGCTTLVAACPPLREPFPLGPVVDGLRRLAPQVADLGLSPLAGALRPLFPDWGDQLPPALEALEDPRETRHRLLGALTELLGRLGVEVLVVEDAHWADTATLEWLLTLAAAEPVLWSIAVTYRPYDVAEGSLLLQLTSRLPAGMVHTRVELKPLGVEQTRELVGSMLGAGEVSEEFAVFLHGHTDGVPLAVEETVRLMRDRRDIIRRRGSWSRKVLDELAVPPAVRDSVLERVGRLDPVARRVLEAASIVAAPADESLLAAVAGVGQRVGRWGVAVALASGLLRETGPGRFVFRHALDAQAVGDAVPVSRRRHLHARAAAALVVREPQPVVLLAHHYREAGDTQAWCHYSEAAADLAIQSGDDRTAVTILSSLLAGVEHDTDRKVRLARKLGDTAVRGTSALGDRTAKVADSLREVLADPDTSTGGRGELRLLLGRLLRWSGHMEAAYEEIEAAVPGLADQPALACRAMMLLGMPLVIDRPAEWHLRWVDQATAQLAWVEPRAERLSLLLNRATALLLLGEEAGWSAAAQIPSLAATPYEQRVIAVAMNNIGKLAIIWGRYAEAKIRLGGAIELMQATGYQRVLNATRVACARLDWCTGEWEELGDTIAKLAAHLEIELTMAVHQDARSIEGLLKLAKGSLRAAEQCLRGVVNDERARGDFEPDSGLPAAAGLGRLYLAEGTADAALAVTEPVIAVVTRKRVWLWVSDIASVHCDALITADRLDEADALVREFAAGIAGRDAPAAAAALVLCRGIVADAHGDSGEAAQLFAEAAHAWASMPRPYDELLSLERHGRCLLAAGEHDRALTVLADTEHRLNEMGARWDADRVAHLLRQQGVKVARTWRRGPRGYGDQLSPRELEVVELVARGMTNGQIADSLFISPKTVAKHVTVSMRKLDVSSRTSLAMAAAEAGLLSADVSQ